jgi:hypothetical protein
VGSAHTVAVVVVTAADSSPHEEGIMRSLPIILAGMAVTTAFTTAFTTALAAAPVAAAKPECTQTGPTTTQCVTNGSAQITTSPPNVTPGFGLGGW